VSTLGWLLATWLVVGTGLAAIVMLSRDAVPRNRPAIVVAVIAAIYAGAALLVGGAALLVSNIAIHDQSPVHHQHQDRLPD
jgi:hypothetical protein